MRANRSRRRSTPRSTALERQPELAFEKDFLRWMLSDGAGAALLEERTGRPRHRPSGGLAEILSYAGEMETCMYAGAPQAGERAGLIGWRQVDAERRQTESVFGPARREAPARPVVRYTVEKPLGILRRREGSVRRRSTTSFPTIIPFLSRRLQSGH